ncbi:tRNA (guanine(37)-N1)-methyltransferase 1 isoform X2 [Morus notabilis]|uniref:tRNA (guanine(37)-N1)-methyltransferase 1 isoform X2 n=1 Tax=Morus notabilis TaxID=981085 RepID=UPI000CED4E89|nr:tRNA (guanine(37)-N1)-methyltransferase 1 isoform X2 [Morus notabilis]
MVATTTTKLFLRPPHSLPLFFSLFPKPPSSLGKLPLSFSSLSIAAAAVPYGPSLRKGTFPSFPEPDSRTFQNQSERSDDGDYPLDEERFTRVFDVAALRVPSRDCFALESRLRGHLLNWPRVRNIVRIPGDDVDEEMAELVGERGGEFEIEDATVSLSRRIYGKAEGDGGELSPVLRREEMAKNFDSRGFLNFRSLARMTRPRRRRKRREEGKRRIGRSGFAVVEVVEEDEDEDDEEDLKGLLGEELKRRKWRGPTRLLLLDERYSTKCVDELPQAIKAVLKENATESTFEVVRCKLTLFYDYWQMNEILEALLPEGMIVPSAFETVGHIAHLNLRDEHVPYKKLIAKVILDKNKPKIQTVVNKIDAIHNDYRTMQLEVLGGNQSLVTTVVENGLRFHVDLASVYWNSRLATERQRLLNGFTRKDVVCDVFSGVGPIAISAAKIVKRVYANDLNPHAIEYLERNSVLNKLERKIKVFNMDGRRFIISMFSNAFWGILRGRTQEKEFPLPMIHVYGFSKARDPEFDFHERIRIALSEVAVDVEMRRVRLVAPGKWMLCASFILPKSVAFAKPMHDM